MVDDSPTGEGDSSGKMTRRSLLALTGAAGLGLASTGTASAAPEYLRADGENQMIENLDVGGNRVVNAGKLAFSGQYASIQTNPSSDSVVGFYDRNAGEWFLQAKNGETDSGEAGPVSFRAPIEAQSVSVDGWDVVDLVAAGADPTGNTDVTSVLKSVVGDNTMIYVPRGTYLMESRFVHTDYDRFGLIGQPHATFTVESDLQDYAFELGTANTAAGYCTIENITFDRTASGVSTRSLQAITEDGFDIDFEVVGKRSNNRRNIEGLILGVLDPDASGYASIQLPDGGAFPVSSDGDYTNEFIGLKIGGTNSNNNERHRGTIYLEDCHVEGFPNNAYYCSSHSGEVHIRNSTAKNCGLSAFRVDGNCSVKNCEVSIDMDPLPFDKAQAAWPDVTNGGDVLYEDMDIDVKSGGVRIVMEDSTGDHRTTFRDFDVDIDPAGTSLVTWFYNEGGSILMDNWTIRNDAVPADENGDKRSLYTIKVYTDDVTMRDVNSTTSNDQLRGVRTNDAADGFRAYNCTLDMGRKAMAIVDTSHAHVRDCTFPRGELKLVDTLDYLRVKDCNFVPGNGIRDKRDSSTDSILEDNAI